MSREERLTEQKFRGKTDIRVTYVTNRIVFDRVYLKIERRVVQRQMENFAGQTLRARREFRR